jgi:hypothetical protein
LFPHLSVRVAFGFAIVFTAVVIYGWRTRSRASRLRLELDAKAELLDAAIAGQAKLQTERDAAVVALKDRRHVYALETLQRHAMLRINGSTPRVTVRYCSYGQDYELAKKVQEIFAKDVKWPVVLDGSNTPALMRAEQFKVVFDTGMTAFAYGDLVHAFSEGNLLGVTVGVRKFQDRLDDDHLIVSVLPWSESAALIQG